MNNKQLTDKSSGIQVAEKPEMNGKTAKLDIDRLFPFPNHPFQLYTEGKMQDMIESIRENGILSPIVVRPNPNGDGYEIISGHNRVEACRQAGIAQIPGFIKEVDDDTAIILLVDSNLQQREKLTPTEKAKAYEMKMEAMKRKVGRKSKNVSQVGTQKRTDQIIAEQVGESRNQIQRYIRLNRLIPALQTAVDDGKLSFNPAVELSYLDPADQSVVQDLMLRDQIAPSLSQAQKLKKLAETNRINEEEIERVMTVEKPMYETITFRRNTVEHFFPEGTTGKQIEQIILRLLENYQREWRAERNRGDMER